MNNSKIARDNAEPEEELDRSASLEKKQGEWSQVVEAINRVEASESWQKLKALVLDGVVENIERQLSLEASKKEIDTSELYRLQGQLMWAKKYADLKKLGELFKKQIEGIKLQLNYEQIPRDGAL